MDHNPPTILSVFFIVMVIGTVAGLIGLFVGGVLASFTKDIRDDWRDDENDGGDEGFTPDPWGPSGTSNPIEEHEEELTCQ